MSKQTLSENAQVILGVMVENGLEPSTAAEIYETISFATFGKQSMAGLLGGLVRKGLVEKTAESPRKYFATDFGAEVVEKNFVLEEEA